MKNLKQDIEININNIKSRLDKFRIYNENNILVNIRHNININLMINISANIWNNIIINRSIYESIKTNLK